MRLGPQDIQLTIAVLWIILQRINQIIVTRTMVGICSCNETDFIIPVLIDVANLRRTEFPGIGDFLGAYNRLTLYIPNI